MLPTLLHDNLAGCGPGLRAPALQVRETEVLTKDRKQSRSKLKVNITARREAVCYLDPLISSSYKPCPISPLKLDQNFLLQETVPGKQHPARLHASIHSPLIQSSWEPFRMAQALSSL